MNNYINYLRDKYGLGLNETSSAIRIFGEHEEAIIEYLKESGLAVARYKIINGEKVKYTKDDLIKDIKQKYNIK